MLRITPIRAQPSPTTTLKLEGKLNRLSVAEFAKACLPHLLQPEHLELDFTAVSFVDRAGVECVRDLLRRDVRVRGCSQLIATLLQEDQE